MLMYLLAITFVNVSFISFFMGIGFEIEEGTSFKSVRNSYCSLASGQKDVRTGPAGFCYAAFVLHHPFIKTSTRLSAVHLTTNYRNLVNDGMLVRAHGLSLCVFFFLVQVIGSFLNGVRRDNRQTFRKTTSMPKC